MQNFMWFNPNLNIFIRQTDFLQPKNCDSSSQPWPSQTRTALFFQIPATFFSQKQAARAAFEINFGFLREISQDELEASLFNSQKISLRVVSGFSILYFSEKLTNLEATRGLLLVEDCSQYSGTNTNQLVSLDVQITNSSINRKRISRFLFVLQWNHPIKNFESFNWQNSKKNLFSDFLFQWFEQKCNIFR